MTFFLGVLPLLGAFGTGEMTAYELRVVLPDAYECRVGSPVHANRALCSLDFSVLCFVR